MGNIDTRDMGKKMKDKLNNLLKYKCIVLSLQINHHIKV